MQRLRFRYIGALFTFLRRR